MIKILYHMSVSHSSLTIITYHFGTIRSPGFIINSDTGNITRTIQEVQDIMINLAYIIQVTDFTMFSITKGVT